MKSYHPQTENILRELSVELHEYTLASPGQNTCFIKNHEVAANPYSALAQLSKLLEADPHIVRQNVQNIAEPLNECIQIFQGLSEAKQTQAFEILTEIVVLANEIASKNSQGIEQKFVQALNTAVNELEIENPKDNFFAKLRRKATDQVARLNQLILAFSRNYNPAQHVEAAPVVEFRKG